MYSVTSVQISGQSIKCKIRSFLRLRLFVIVSTVNRKKLIKRRLRHTGAKCLHVQKHFNRNKFFIVLTNVNNEKKV